MANGAQGAPSAGGGGSGRSRRGGGCRPGARRRCSSWCAVAPVLRRRSGTAAASERRERRTTDDGAYWCTVSRWRRVEAESAARWQSVRRRREGSAKPWKYVNHEVAGRKACIAPCLRMEGMEKGGGGEEPPPVRLHDHLSIAEESRPPVHWEPILNNSQSIGFQDLLGKNPRPQFSLTAYRPGAIRRGPIIEASAILRVLIFGGYPEIVGHIAYYL